VGSQGAEKGTKSSETGKEGKSVKGRAIELATLVLVQWVAGMEPTHGLNISENRLVSLRWSTSGTQWDQLNSASFY